MEKRNTKIPSWVFEGLLWGLITGLIGNLFEINSPKPSFGIKNWGFQLLLWLVAGLLYGYTVHRWRNHSKK